MRKSLILFLFLVFFSGNIVNAQFQRDSAINLVLNHLLINDIGHINVALYRQKKSHQNPFLLAYGDSIECPYDLTGYFL